MQVTLLAALPYYDSVGGIPPEDNFTEDLLMNNCLCHLFDDNCTWIIIIALIILFCCACNG